MFKENIHGGSPGFKLTLLLVFISDQKNGGHWLRLEAKERVTKLYSLW